MKNIQIIDGAVNCVYDLFAATDEQFELIFPNGTDIAFIDEVEGRLSKKEFERAFSEIWSRRVAKATANGIHGTLFFELASKKQFYPTRKDEEAVNPGGTRIR